MYSISDSDFSEQKYRIVSKRPGNISRRVFNILQNNRIQKTIQEITMQPRYQKLSRAEQDCITCFFSGKKETISPTSRLARNHHRADIGAWLLMHHLPVHPLLTTLTDASQSRLQELLPDEDDRTIFGRCCRIHTYLHHHDLEGYLSFIQTLPAEEQSLTFQTYKQLIIGRMSHMNGHSIYFPYLPAEKSNIPYDLTSLYAPELLEQFPGYQEQLDLLRSSPEHISPPRSTLQELFHDLIFISSIGYQLKNPELLAELHQIRSDSRVGFVAPHAYPRELFVSLSDPGTLSSDQPTTERSTTGEDAYLMKSYATLSSMWGCTNILLQDRATLHEAYQQHGSYAIEKLDMLKNIRHTIELLSRLNGRIDLHYFIRHLPSISDEDNFLVSQFTESINTKKELHKRINSTNFISEKHLLLLTSEWQYAIMSAALYLSLQTQSNLSFQINTYIGINNDSKEKLQPIRDLDERWLSNKAELLKLLYYLNFLPTTSIHITHGRVLKWIRDTYGFKSPEPITDESTSYLLPISSGSYQEDGICSSPGERIKTLEQLRLLMHAYSATHHLGLEKYRAPVHQDALQSFSTNDFLYRIVDCLREIANQDKDLYTDLYEQLLEVTCSTKTIHCFLEEHHKLIHPTPRDGHTE